MLTLCTSLGAMTNVCLLFSRLNRSPTSSKKTNYRQAAFFIMRFRPQGNWWTGISIFLGLSLITRSNQTLLSLCWMTSIAKEQDSIVLLGPSCKQCWTWELIETTLSTQIQLKMKTIWFGPREMELSTRLQIHWMS